MATLRADSLLFVLLFLNLNVFCSEGEIKIPAKPGQNVILPCRAAENKSVIVLDWSRTDLREHEHVALYRDDKFDNEYQHAAYKDRVDLQDREMKDGDVSLVLKNVMINDNGTYECRVDYDKNKRMKRSHLKFAPICSIILELSPPGNKEGQNEDEKNNNGLIVGLSVGFLGLALLGGVGFLLYIRWKQKQNPPPAAGTELQHMNDENNHEPDQ